MMMRKSRGLPRIFLATSLGSLLLLCLFYFQSSLNPAAEDRILKTIWHGKAGRSPLQTLYYSDQDETGKVIEEFTNRMVKLAHVPVQTWKGTFDFDWSQQLGEWWSWMG